MEKQWYELLFENFANTYEKEEFTKGTLQEVNFIEEELHFDKTKRILDVGCGTGRHAIELAARGYTVTAFDLSQDQIDKAIKNAENANVTVDFFTQDARTFTFKEKFDLVIMLCEGSFPLMETDEMNFAILQNAFSSLKQNGKFIFTTLNGLFPLFHSVKDFLNSKLEAGDSRKNNFDLMTFRDYSEYTIKDDLGITKTIHCNERYYVPPEITWLLKSIGFSKINISGGVIGEFSRKIPLGTDHYEMLVIAEKL
jgi:2-polyprenyl-3-methyl-5-hydroxy-6-metoxy-1,4-benzoquinol methylase